MTTGDKQIALFMLAVGLALIVAAFVESWR
jgi:hypothetical protein